MEDVKWKYRTHHCHEIPPELEHGAIANLNDSTPLMHNTS